MKTIFQFFGVLLLLGAFGACTVENSTVVDAGSGDGVSGSITKFAVMDDYMYVLNLDEILTYDITDRVHPRKIDVIQTEFGLETIFIYEDAIYLGSRSSLYILDISEPSQPRVLSKTDRSQEFFDACDPVAVEGNYAYSTVKVVQNVCGDVGTRSALLVFNVTNKRRPSEVGAYDLDEPNGLGIQGQALFVCDAGSDQVRIFNIDDPESLVEYENLAIDVQNPIDLIIDNNTLIVSAQTYFEIYNIEDLKHIYKVGEIDK